MRANVGARARTEACRAAQVLLRVCMSLFIRSGHFLAGTSLAEATTGILAIVERGCEPISPGCVRGVLCAIARSRRGLTDAEIMGACALNRYTWARLALVLDGLLVGLDGLVNFHHQVRKPRRCIDFQPRQHS